ELPQTSAESRFAERNDGADGARPPAPSPEVLCTTASGVRRRDPRLLALAASAAARGPRWLAAAASAAARGPRWLALAASAAARGPRWLAAAASAAARGPRWLAAARVSGPAFPAAVFDPVASDPVDVVAAADCRLLVLDRSSVHVRPDAQRVADCHRADPAHGRRAVV